MKSPRLILLFILLITQCIRFKYDNLSANLITKIRLGNSMETIEAVNNNNVVTNIPIQIPVSSDYLYIADYEKSMIKLYDYSGNLEMVIGNISGLKKDQKFKVNKLKLASIGAILPGSDDDVFIENRNIDATRIKVTVPTDPFESFSGNFKPSVTEQSNSVIYHVSLENGLIHTIGEKGSDSEPFQYIEKLYLLKNNQLAVLYYKDDKQYLSIYKDKQPIYTLGENTIQPLHSGEDGLNAYLDTIIPHISGKYSLLSYKYFDKKNSRFKFRRIFRYDHEKGTSEQLKEIQDPAEILFAVKEDNDFYIWETETSSGSIRLQLHDNSGYHYNNKRIVFPAPRAQWRETYTDADDNLYSIRVRSGNLEIYKWN